MISRIRHGVALIVLAVSGILPASAQDTKTFKLKGTNPDGKGGYTGTVEIKKQGENTAVRWITGTNKSETQGLAVEGANVIGIGYGGAALYAVAVYELEGKTIHARWAMTSAPETAGKYDLVGSPEFTGTYKFADGTAGTVKMTPGAGGKYKMAWDLPSGHFEGIGVRAGNALVAVSGEPGKMIGACVFRNTGQAFEGLWTNTGLGVGKEVWSAPEGMQAVPVPAPASTAKASAEGKTITFGGEEYALKDNKSAPGQATSELREYLRAGEDWDGYRKMVGVRMQLEGRAGNASVLAKGTLAETKKNFPDSYTKEVLMEPDHAVIFFIVVSGNDAEMNLFDYRRTKNGIPSVQFVMRNKAPYETKPKFKAEQDAHYDEWLAELAALSLNADEILAATGKSGATAAAPAAPAAAGGKNDIPPELVKAIGADLQKCGAIAEKFMGALKTGDVKGAVALMSDRSFTKMSREDFTAGLTQSVKSFGAFKSFAPDRTGTDFGVVNGVMTFTLKGDGVYENSASKETFKFSKNGKGEPEMINYLRDPK